ncbi:unnamed protein product [Spodoptera exigua]|nr:unnamed protein product [Spodoptera exigua]
MSSFVSFVAPLKTCRQRKFSLTGSSLAISESCSLPSLLESKTCSIVSVYSISLSSETSLIFFASFKRSRRKFFSSSASMYPLPSVSYSRHIFINSTLDSKGLSNLKRRRKFSSIGSSCASSRISIFPS